MPSQEEGPALTDMRKMMWTLIAGMVLAPGSCFVLMNTIISVDRAYLPLCFRHWSFSLSVWHL
ncbi:MAG: hypothetical protein MZV63_23035 [Marinilabiliales bacterium]|nr:hypothetical protein [Marinilabiliales bacterium]